MPPFKPVPNPPSAVPWASSSSTPQDEPMPSQPDKLADAKASSLTRVKKRTMTIIIVGETGVGKTAFMSLLANVCAGRQIDNFRLEHNTANESNLSKNQSQTNTAMMYTFKRRDGCTLRILDTPGLCDTRGLEQDKEHKKSIAEAIKSQVQTLDGVIIMANGTLERVGPGVEYALHTLSTMFPRSIVNNIGFMFTNVPDALSFNFQSNTLPEALRNVERWTIQNPVAQFVKYQEANSSNSRRPQSQQQLRALQRLLHSNFAITMETLNDFFAWLDERKAQPTNTILQLYEMTTRIEAAISNVLAQIDQREQQRMDLQRLQANLDKSNQTMNINQEYESIMSRTLHVQTDTYHHNTLCTARDCYSNCHEYCELEFLLDPNEIRRRCLAFTSYGRQVMNCVVCHHSYRDHHHFHTRWDVETTSETVTDDNAQRKYNEAQSEVYTIQYQKSTIEQAINRFESEIQQHEEHLGKLCIEFQDVALSGSFAGHIASAIRLLEVRLSTMKSNGTDAQSIGRMEGRIASLQQRLDIVERARQASQVSHASAAPAARAAGEDPKAVKRGWRSIVGRGKR